MIECWDTNSLPSVIPSPEDLPPPPRADEAAWEIMSPSEKRKHKLERARLHTKNAQLRSKRELFLRKVGIAKDLGDQEFWYPHFSDFRGRMYPLPQDLTPQGDDFAKGLLMFSEKRPLGPDGLYWLTIRLANTFGNDKLSFDDRITWANDHAAEIVDSAEAPLDGARFWTMADEPWCFLATAMEWAEATSHRRPDEYVSQLPIPLDGSCNGLQHLSLMGRDDIGARATNCSADPVRHDLYSEVADATGSVDGLGAFLLGTLAPSVRERDTFAGMIAGLIVMTAVWLQAPVAFPWYVVIGSVTTCVVALGSRAVVPSRA